MRVAITGSTGLIGTALMTKLQAAGHEVVPLARSGKGPSWGADGPDLAGCEAVIHLAGENIGGRRWTQRQRRRIVESRTVGTGIIAQAAADAGCRVMLSMSASGFYGDRDEPAAESAEPGTGFLAEVCQAWEAAAEPARTAGVRVIHPRMAVVLSRKGGALHKMWLPFRLGLGGPIAGGRQWLPWITLDDAAAALVHLLESDVQGPVNVAAGAARNRDFVKALGRAMHRPAFMPLPGFAMWLLFGRMGMETVVQGQAMQTDKLRASGFEVRHADLDAALAGVVAR